MKRGRGPENPLRDYLRKRFDIPRSKYWHWTEEFMMQVAMCADDSARRLLLGVSR